MATRNKTRPSCARNYKLQGHNEKECFVLHLKLYPKEEGGEETEEDKSKNNNKKINTVPEKKKNANKGKSTDNNFQEPKIKIGAKRGGYHYREGQIQIWNPKEKVSDEDLLMIGNKFDALNEEEGTKEPSQQQENIMIIAMPKAGKSTKEKVVVATKD
ncbi:hypothetical protein KY285_010882 [Solanum tuberosum]|nr:hypothetical protein KY289_011456 [Solanum tuberosum]KAH0735175.1 hypothetical protein KY285_010882 [Solanum tuberosum]